MGSMESSILRDQLHALPEIPKHQFDVALWSVTHSMSMPLVDW